MTVGLNVDDALLFDALKVMLSDLGHTLACESASVIITDNPNFTLSGSRVIYIGKGEQYKANGTYICRPFLKEELGRMLNKLSASENECGIKIDKKHSRIIFNGERIELTEKEILLFCLLYENKGKAVSNEAILERVWKNETAQGSNIVAVYIKYLRAKLDEKVGIRLIFRVRGIGYMLKINEKE